MPLVGGKFVVLVSVGRGVPWEWKFSNCIDSRLKANIRMEDLLKTLVFYNFGHFQYFVGIETRIKKYNPKIWLVLNKIYISWLKYQSNKNIISAEILATSLGREHHTPWQGGSFFTKRTVSKQ